MSSQLGKFSLPSVGRLEAHWDELASAAPGEVSVELRTLDGPVARLRPGTPHYAASTVKLAVLGAALAQVSAGRLDLGRKLEITDTFPSATGGWFTMRQIDDQDDATWERLGGWLPVGTLLERMIVESGNLATNTVLQVLTLDPVRQLAAASCGDELTVNRLIGDQRAEAAGVTNTVTARALGAFLSALAAGTLLPADATWHALAVLARQRHLRMIPAGLPPGTWSASKGGWTAAVRHDVALVRPDQAPAYVLAVCTSTGLDDAADRLVARLSAVTWEYWSQWHAS